MTEIIFVNGDLYFTGFLPVDLSLRPDILDSLEESGIEVL